MLFISITLGDNSIPPCKGSHAMPEGWMHSTMCFMMGDHNLRTNKNKPRCRVKMLNFVSQPAWHTSMQTSPAVTASKQQLLQGTSEQLLACHLQHLQDG
jgi:hypothetical protein